MRHIVCFGDSNTHGYYPTTDEKGYGRFDENQRWTRLLQKRLGSGYLVFEEGLTGRTTAFDDPLRESMNGLQSIYSCIMSHEPVDLLIVMLGTNDVKERFAADAEEITAGMERLLLKAKSIPGWRDEDPRILLMSPPHISAERSLEYYKKSSRLAEGYAMLASRHGLAFLDVQGIGEFNKMDFMHLTQKGHEKLAVKLEETVRRLLEM